MGNPFAGIIQEKSLRSSIDSTIDEVVDFGWHKDNNFRSILKETAAHEAHYGRLDSKNPMQVDEITYRNFEQEPQIWPLFKALGAKIKNGKLDRDDLKTNIITAAMKYSWHDSIPKGPRGFKASGSQAERAQQWKDLYNTKAGKGTPEKFLKSLEIFKMREKPQTSLLDFILPSAEASENPFSGIISKEPIKKPTQKSSNPFAGIITEHPEEEVKKTAGFGKMMSESGKAILRGIEGSFASIGATMKWAGDIKERASIHESDKKIGRTISEWGETAHDFWRTESLRGIEAPDPEIFKGSFMENPSWTRGVSIVAGAIPSLATATGISIATGNPFAGAAALGLLEGSGQYVEAREAGKDVALSTLFGSLSTVGNTLLEVIPLTRFMKGGSAKLPKDIFIGAIQEGGEEVLQALWTNTIAKLGYDKTRDLTEGMVEGFIGGAGSGGVMGGVTSGRGIQTDKLAQEAVQKGVTPQELETMQEGVKNQIVSKANEIDNVLDKSAKKVVPIKEPKSGGLPHTLPETLKKKGVKIEDLKSVIAIDKTMTVKDIHGDKVELPEGEEYRAYELSNGQVLLQDGKQVVVNKGQFQNVKGQQVELGEKPSGVKEVWKGGKKEELSEIPEGGTPKFSQHQAVKGGENYRELLLTAPQIPGVPTKDIPRPDGSIVKDVPATTYKSPHYDEPNVVSHIRMSDFTTPDGKKVLQIQEIQSDWAREGREKGFGKKSLPEGWKIKNEPGNTFGDWVIRDENNKIQYGGKTQEQMWKDYESNPRNMGVPFHPAVKNWKALSVRKILETAVREGYDYVALPTGEQTAQLYDLSKQIGVINWHKNELGDGKIRIDALTPDLGTQVINESFKPEELEKVVGKDVARKIIDGEGQTDELHSAGRRMSRGELKGLDLKTGGEALKSLYDVQIPAEFKKLGAEITKIKVGREGADVDIAGEPLHGERDLIQPAIAITPKLKTRVIGQPKAGGVVPPIPPEVSPEEKSLIEEAKKYKTAEEFVVSQLPVDRGYKGKLETRIENGKQVWKVVDEEGWPLGESYATQEEAEQARIEFAKTELPTVDEQITRLKKAGIKDSKINREQIKIETANKWKRRSTINQSQLTDIWKKAQEKPKVSGVAGAMVVPSGVVKESGYGIIESSEKASKEKIAKTDYSKIVGEITKQEFGIVDEALKMVSPAERKGALMGKKILRKNIAELAHKDVVVVETLQKVHKTFKWMNTKDRLDFIDRVETGQSQKTPKLQKSADIFRGLLDGRRTDIQNLGKGKLEEFIENYFPHIWKDPKKAKDIISSIMGKKRLEGTKAFLKKRVVVSVKEGVEKGLEPVSDNPVDLVLLKLHEMDRYIMAQNMIRELKENGLIKFVYARNQSPDGYVRVNDSAFTVYMPPEITKKDYYDSIMVNDLIDVATSLGINTKRFVSIGGKRVGYAKWYPGIEGGEKVRTKYASPESVLAHEIGHILGVRYNLYNLLGRRNDGEWKVHKEGKKEGQRYFKPSKEAVEYRRKIDQQWRDLADARAKGLDPKKYPGFYKYLRKAREKEAVMLEALMHAPEEFRRTAPDLYKVFTAFLNNNAELRPMLDIKPSLVLGENEAKIKIPGFTTLGHYYASEATGRLLNNYLSPGLRNNENKIISSGYNMLRGAGNVLNQAQLALSLFHALNVTSDMAASTFGLGLRRLSVRGQRIRGLTDIISVPISPITTIWNGIRIRKAYTQQIDSITDPKLKQMVEAVINAGGRDRMDVFYYNNQIKALQKTFSDIVKGDAFTKVKSSLKLPFNLFGATLESLAKPLMEWYVPTGKMGLFSKLAQHEMERAETGQINDEQLWERLTQVWDSVDNRMGQLIYDNLFWGKTLKDSLMLSIRSVGWNLGSWREFAGAAVDIVTTQERIKRGDIWFSHKMAYTVGAVTIYSVLGAIIQYCLTGKPPEEPKDYLFPKTGKKNPDGSNERLSLPTYAKDWYAWSHQPLKTVTHKIHPLWGVLGDLATNKDYFNVEIRHTDDPLYKELQQVLAHIGKSSKSISIRNYEKMERVSPGAKRNLWVSITGIASAPSYITRSPAQKLMTRLIVERIPPKAKTKEQFERSTYRRTLKNRIRKGERIDSSEAIKILGIQSYKRMLKEVKRTPFADSFNRLGLKDCLNVYSIASEEEKRQVQNILRGKYRRAKSYTKTKDVRDLYRELVGF